MTALLVKLVNTYVAMYVRTLYDIRSIGTLALYLLVLLCVIRGYQQCLASIVASLVGNRLPGGVAYKVDELLMKRLQVLLKDGNVDG